MRVDLDPPVPHTLWPLGEMPSPTSTSSDADLDLEQLRPLREKSQSLQRRKSSPNYNARRLTPPCVAMRATRGSCLSLLNLPRAPLGQIQEVDDDDANVEQIGASGARAVPSSSIWKGGAPSEVLSAQIPSSDTNLRESKHDDTSVGESVFVPK